MKILADFHILKRREKIILNFTYSGLQSASRKGQRLGNWQGSSVYAASKRDLKDLGNGVYYIIYDDGNKIVKRIDNAFYSYGVVCDDGSVDEGKMECYMDFTPKSKPQKKRETEKYEEVVGDVKLGLTVDETLKGARNMTVDSLLEGFSYGLD